MDDTMDRFDELSLELTDRCPLNCVHCSSNSNPLCSHVLSDEILTTLIEEADSLRVRKISLGGGEPSIAESFVRVIEQVSSLGIPTEVFTSGITDNNELKGFSDEFVRKLSGVDKLKMIFSLYSGSSHIHDQITQTRGSFIATTRSIKKCLAFGLEVEVNFVPLKSNLYELERLIDLIKSYGLNKINILRFVPQGRGGLNRNKLELSTSEEDSLVSRILELRKADHFEIRTGSPFNGIIPDNRVPCRAGFSKLVVQADGNVLPCEVFKHHQRRDWNLSVYKHSLKEILTSSQIIALRNQLSKSNCLKCPVHSGLRNRCRKGILSVQ